MEQRSGQAVTSLGNKGLLSSEIPASQLNCSEFQKLQTCLLIAYPPALEGGGTPREALSGGHVLQGPAQSSGPAPSGAAATEQRSLNYLFPGSDGSRHQSWAGRKLSALCLPSWCGMGSHGCGGIWRDVEGSRRMWKDAEGCGGGWSWVGGQAGLGVAPGAKAPLLLTMQEDCASLLPSWWLTKIYLLSVLIKIKCSGSSLGSVGEAIRRLSSSSTT